MPVNPISFANTPQAVDDTFLASSTGLTEDSTTIVWLNVMANDLGGQARTLYSVDDGSGTGGTSDLLVQDTARAESVSADTSRAGARIWITADGQVGYDTATLRADFAQQLQALNAGETLTDSFTYAIRLGNGTLSWATATVQFAGANDVPVVSGAVLGNAVEDGLAVTLDALANASDVDRGSVLHVVDVPATLPAGVTYDEATHSFSIDPSNAAYQHLGANQVLPVTVLYGVSDGTATTQAVVTFTVLGVNDAAHIGDVGAHEVTEDSGAVGGLLSASGTLAITDVDDNEASFHTAVSSQPGNLGTMGLASDGSYTYSVANAAVQFLGEGESRMDTFAVSSVDGTTRQVSFTVHGVNDAAVIGAPTVSTVVEDMADGAGQLTAAGSLSITDADQNQATFSTSVTSAAGNLGSLTLAADGNYTYAVANSAVQYLGGSETKVDTFSVTSFDGTTKDVSFTVRGVNDAAVIGDPTAASVTEDANVSAGSLSAIGTLSVTDVDQNQSSFQTSVASAVGNVGSLTLAADGSYTYAVANSAVQSLGTLDTKVDTFTVTSFDGTTKDVSFTVQGTNDAAVIGDPTAASVTEDANVSAGFLSAAGTLSITDVDQNQSSFQTSVASAAGNLGSLTLAADGSYTYAVANSAAQSLGGSDTKVDTFTVTSFDGTTKDVSFTIQGANDAAVIGDPIAASVTEDVSVSAGSLSATGTLSIGDVDLNQSSFKTTVDSAAENLGSLVLSVDGNYTYSVANSAVQFLGATQTKVDTFTVSAADGTTKQVSFTVNGVNDAAVIGAPPAATVTEDVGVSAGALSATGTLPITDPDQGQAVFQTTVAGADGNLGTLVLGTNGAYTYSADNAAVQFLDAAHTHVDAFTVAAADGSTSTVNFTIQGADDQAAIGGIATGTVREDTAVSATGKLATAGQLTISDADAGQSAFQAQASAAGTYGTFTLGATGAWTYVVDNSLAAVQGLNTGHSLSDTFTATSLDGSSSQLVTVTIQGLDDGLVGTTRPDVYSFQATASGSQTISDPGGNGDEITILGNNTPLTVLNVERLGNDLQLQVNNQTVTVLNHYGLPDNAVEQLTFASGQTFAGYSLAGTYTLFAGAGFVAGNGNSNDVIAGTSVAQTLDGGGGASGRDLLFGNGGNDALVGQGANDLLVGGAGDDSLQGGDGNDVLVGGSGNDLFVFNTAPSANGNADHIADFHAGGDAVVLSKGTFAALATSGSSAGTPLLAADFFSAANAGSATVGANVHIVYDTATGNLFYDANGGDSGQRTLFATLDAGGLTGSLTATDFKVGL